MLFSITRFFSQSRFCNSPTKVKCRGHKKNQAKTDTLPKKDYIRVCQLPAATTIEEKLLISYISDYQPCEKDRMDKPFH